jgi:TatD DNase family protein
MSFDGPITFSHDYDEVIKMLPLESIMVETDSPFAAPEPYRKNERTGISGRAEPWMVREVVKSIARIRTEGQGGGQVSEEIVRLAMLENTKQFFKILL